MKNFNLIGVDTVDSLSPYIHNFVFDQMGIKAKYSSINIECVSDIEEITKKIKSGLIEGVNITNPYKIDAIKYLDVLDVSAEKIGAVNCLSLKGGKLWGYNTDWFGFKKMIIDYKINFNNKKIKIIGNGGAALAVRYAFENMGLSKIDCYNRKNTDFNLLDLQKSLDDESFVINATPYHFVENDFFIFNKIQMTNLIWVDLLYTKLSTEKNKEIDKNRYFHGLDMLIYQALASIDIWFRKNISNSVDLSNLKLYLKEVIDA